MFTFVVSRLSSRRASNQWAHGYFRRRSSPLNLPIYHESGGQGKEPSSPPVSHSSVESNSSGMGNDSPPVTINLLPMLNASPTSEYIVLTSQCSAL